MVYFSLIFECGFWTWTESDRTCSESGQFTMFVSDSSGSVGGSTPPPSLVQEDGQCWRGPDGEVHVGSEAAGLVLSWQTGGAAAGQVAERYFKPNSIKKKKNFLHDVN